MTRFALHKLGALTALLSFAALLAAPQAFAADISPPQLESFNLLTTEINVTDGPASVYAEFRVTDDESGIERPQIYAYSDTTTQRGKTFGSTVSVLSSSNGGLNILFRAEIVINQGSAPGPWTVRLNGLQDNQGNRGPTGPAKLAGYNTAFSVVEDGPDQSSTDASSSSSDTGGSDTPAGVATTTGGSNTPAGVTTTTGGSNTNTPAGVTTTTGGSNTPAGVTTTTGGSNTPAGVSCDPAVDFGCATSGDGASDTSAPTGSTSSSDGASDTSAPTGTAANCDLGVYFGCTSSSDGASDSDTSGSVSSLGVTLEEPAVGLVHMGVGNLRGWAVSSAGIRKVEAFLDGEFLGEIPYGGARTDVGLAFPDIDGSDQSGFGMSFNYSGLSAGIHTIEVVAHSIDNKTASDSAQFETVRFDREFIGAGEVINLNAAASVLTNDQIRVENISIAGEYYNLLLRWRTAEQGFEIVEIEALD